MLDRVEPRGTRTVDYPVRAEVRGRYVVGPLTIRLSDPFGMCELVRSFSARDMLVVTPVVQRLPAVALGGDWAGSGDSRSRSVAAAGEDDVATREYRHGDDLRRVHWRSTARQGELMVRREEQPWESHCTLLLDSRSTAHRGDGPASSFEWAVSAAASIGAYAGRAGYTVDLVTDTGAHIEGSGTGTDQGIGGQEAMLLDGLASVELTGATTLKPGDSLPAGGCRWPARGGARCDDGRRGPAADPCAPPGRFVDRRRSGRRDLAFGQDSGLGARPRHRRRRRRPAWRRLAGHHRAQR